MQYGRFPRGDFLGFSGACKLVANNLCTNVLRLRQNLQVVCRNSINSRMYKALSFKRSTYLFLLSRGALFKFQPTVHRTLNTYINCGRDNG